MINIHDPHSHTPPLTDSTGLHEAAPENKADTTETNISEEDKHIAMKSWALARQKALATLGNSTGESSSTQQTETGEHHNTQLWPQVRARALASLNLPDSKTLLKRPPKQSDASTSNQPKNKAVQETSTNSSTPNASARLSISDTSHTRASEQATTSKNQPSSTSLNKASGPSAMRQYAGRDGFFYFLTPKGNLHRYDPTVDAVLNTGQKNISVFTMGANGKPYALIDQRLVNLNAHGAIAQVCSGTLNTHDKIKDIAVSPLGDKAYLLNESGGLFTLDLKNLNATPNALKCPLDVTLTELQSVAVGAEGSVWLLGQNNELFKGKYSNDSTSKESIQWSPVDSPDEKLVSLETLQGGDVSGCTTKGDMLTLRHGNTSGSDQWQSVDFNNLNQSSFDRMHNALTKQNPLELITFLGGTATSRAFSKDTLLKPAIALGKVAKSIPRLFEDLKHFDYRKTQTPSIDRFHKQTAQDFKTLKESSLSADFQQTESHGALVNSDLAKSVSKDALDLLNKLDTQLKAKAKGGESSKSKPDQPMEENVLQVVRDARSAVYNSEDPVIQKLDQMLAEGRHIGQNTPPYQGLTAKLASDHAILNEVATSLPNTESSKIKDVIQQHSIQRDNTLSSLLMRSGVAQTDPFGNAAQGFDGIQAIFRQDKDLLNRIINKYQPAIDGKSNKASSQLPTSEIFNNLVQHMKPGDTLSVGKGMDAGFNTETFRVAFSGAWASITGGLANTWVIPILDFGKLKDVELNLSKTQEGLTINVSRSRGKYFQAGIRTGLGIVELPDVSSKKVGTAWGFQGWEIALKDKHSTGKTDAISLTIRDDGHGNIQKAVTDVMTGKADLFDLMSQAKDTSIEQKRTKAHNVTVGNVGVVAGGITMPGWDAALKGKHSDISSIFPVGKVLGAIVPEVALDFGSKKEVSKIHNNHGEEITSQTKQPFGLQSVRGNMIGVGVLESDYLARALGGDMMIGSGEEALGVTGRAGIPSLLPGAILGKTFGKLAPSSTTVSLLSSEDGMPKTLSVSLTVNRTSNLARTISNHSDTLQLPGLKEAVYALTHQQKKQGFNSNMPVTLALELKPEVTQDLPTEKEARKEALIQLGKQMQNFRIASMNVQETRQDMRVQAMPVPAITRSVKASLSATREFANVSFIHDHDSAVKEAAKTIKSIAEFSDATWGAKNSQQRLTHLKQCLENTIDSFGHTNSEWTSGQSLKNDYFAEFNALKDDFLKKTHTAMINKFSESGEEKLTASLIKFVNDSTALREKFKLNAFEGPAIISTGPLFVNPYAGKMNRADSLKMLKDLPLDKIEAQIQELTQIDLSSKTGNSLTKEKQKVEEKINGITRLLGTASDIDTERKERFLLDLYLLPARPSTPSQVSSLINQLNNLSQE